MHSGEWDPAAETHVCRLSSRKQEGIDSQAADSRIQIQLKRRALCSARQHPVFHESVKLSFTQLRPSSSILRTDSAAGLSSCLGYIPLLSFFINPFAPQLFSHPAYGHSYPLTPSLLLLPILNFTLRPLPLRLQYWEISPSLTEVDKLRSIPDVSDLPGSGDLAVWHPQQL